MVYILILLFFVAAAWLWWRWGSVERGAAKRDAEIIQRLEALQDKLSSGADVTRTDVEEVASAAEVRPLLYMMLKHWERLDLFPPQYTSMEAQGEALLSYWMLHPNELQAVPEELHLVDTVSRDLEDDEALFLVYRYRMSPGHWAGRDWILGLAGPFFDQEVPFSGIASAFSRCGDKFGKTEPEDLVDWFVGVVLKVPESKPVRSEASM